MQNLEKKKHKHNKKNIDSVILSNNFIQNEEHGIKKTINKQTAKDIFEDTVCILDTDHVRLY